MSSVAPRGISAREPGLVEVDLFHRRDQLLERCELPAQDHDVQRQHERDREHQQDQLGATLPAAGVDVQHQHGEEDQSDDGEGVRGDRLGRAASSGSARRLRRRLRRLFDRRRSGVSGGESRVRSIRSG